MFKVVLREEARENLRRFIDLYEDGFFKLFEDSGIWSAGIILDQYRLAANNLHEMFIDKIVEKLQANIIFGRKVSGKWIEINFHIGSRLVMVYYTEDKKLKEREVVFIDINRKPILF